MPNRPRPTVQYLAPGHPCTWYQYQYLVLMVSGAGKIFCTWWDLFLALVGHTNRVVVYYQAQYLVPMYPVTRPMVGSYRTSHHLVVHRRTSRSIPTVP